LKTVDLFLARGGFHANDVADSIGESASPKETPAVRGSLPQATNPS
jgi:hypothetical protein